METVSISETLNYAADSWLKYQFIAIRIWFVLLQPGRSSGSAVGLNLETPLYVGRVDLSSVRVSPDVGVERGFTGCISQVTYRTYLLYNQLLALSMSLWSYCRE